MAATDDDARRARDNAMAERGKVLASALPAPSDGSGGGSSSGGGGSVAATRATLAAICDETKAELGGDQLRASLICFKAVPALVALARECPELAAEAVEALAEIAKNERFRDEVGGDAAPLASSLLAAAAQAPGESASLSRQALRLAGNLAAFNEANRALLRLGGLAQSFASLAAAAEAGALASGLAPVALGALANYAASDDETLVAELVDAGIESFVLATARGGDDMLASVALRVVNGLWGERTRERYLGAEVDVLGLLAGALDVPERKSAALMTLTTVLEFSGSHAAALERGLLARLFAEAECGAATAVDDDDDDDAAAALGALNAVAVESAMTAALESLGALPRLAAVCRATRSDDVLKAGLLCVSNLVRSADASVAAVREGLVALALGTTRRGDDALPLQHAALGLVRNVAITPASRDALRDSATIDVMLGVLATPHQPMVFSAASVLRMLTRESEPTARALAGTGATLERLVALAAGETLNIAMECARVLAEIALASAASAGALLDAAAIPAFSRLVQTAYESTRVEGLRAMTVLAQADPARAAAFWASEELLGAIRGWADARPESAVIAALDGLVECFESSLIASLGLPAFAGSADA